MPIFSINGKDYNVREADVAKLAVEHPDAFTVGERDGAKFRVSAKDYPMFMSPSGTTFAPTASHAPEDFLDADLRDPAQVEQEQLEEREAEFKRDINRFGVDNIPSTQHHQQPAPVEQPQEFIWGGGGGIDPTPQMMIRAAKKEMSPTSNAQPTIDEQELADMSATREQVAGMQDFVQGKINDNRSLGDFVPGQMGMLMTMSRANTKRRKDLDAYSAANDALRNAQRIIDEADRNGADGSGNETSFVGGALRGFGQKVFDPTTWDMGLSEMANSGTLLEALDVADSGGELTEAQRTLLDAKAVEMATNAYFGSYLGYGYKAGQVSAESIPFMLEMAINPAAALGKGASAKLTRYALKRYGKEAIRKNAAKYLATKAATRVGADVVGAATMTATTGALGTTADALRRMSGDIEYDLDENGRPIYGGHTEGDDSLRAWYEAITAGAIERASEMAGGYIAPIGKYTGLSKLGGDVVRKITPNGVLKTIDNMSYNDAVQFITNLERKAQWNGVVGEFGEEIYGGILNSVLVGDQTFDTDENTGIFNRENLIETFLGVGLMGGFFSTAKTGAYAVEYPRAKRRLKRADVDAINAFGSADLWGTIKEQLASTDALTRGKAVREILADANLTPEQKEAAVTYVGELQRMDGVRIGLLKHQIDAATPAEEVEVEQSFENGYTLQTPQEKNDARTMLEERANAVRRLYALPEDTDVDEFLGENPLASLLESKKLGQDDSANQIVLNYLNAKSTVEGMYQAVRDDIDGKIAQSDAQVDSRISQTDGRIHPATMKQDDRAVYIMSGEVVLLDDGTIDTAKSTESIIVKDAETGKMEFSDPASLLNVGEVEDAEQTKEALREQIRQSVAGQSEAEILGTLAFAQGDSYVLTDEEGVQHQAQIIADNGDGTVQVALDGATEAVQMPKEQVQAMNDATNRSRAAAYIEQQNAQRESAMQEVAEEQQPIEQPQVEESALSRIPTDENGNQLFEQAPAQDTWSALVELNEGDTTEATDTAQQMLDNAKKELDKATSVKPKGGATVAEIQQDKAERKARVAEAQQKVDYWTEVLNAQQAVQEQAAQEVAQAEEVEETIAQEPNTGIPQTKLNNEEIDAIVSSMEQNAAIAPEIELTPENWVAEFGEDGVIETPIGEVKMGENQYFKLAQKGRESKLGMIKPTLQAPDIIVEERSSAKDGQVAERNSSYVFVKAFTNADGTRTYKFTSVTIRKEGREVVISNQEKETPRIKRLLKEGMLTYISEATLPSEPTHSTQGDQQTIPSGATLSDSKDTTSEPKNQEVEQKISQEEQIAPQEVAEQTQPATEPTAQETQAEAVPTQEQTEQEEQKQRKQQRVRIKVKKDEEARRRPLRKRAQAWAKKVGVEAVLIERFENVENESARKAIQMHEEQKSGQRIPGWYSGGKVYIYLPHATDISDLDQTYIHEVVAHHGMKKMLGEEGYNQFCLKVWDMMEQTLNERELNRWLAYPGVKGDKAKAADEYIAHLAETTESLTELDQSVWDKIVELIRDALRQLGVSLEGDAVAFDPSVEFTNKLIIDALHASKRNLKQSANNQSESKQAEGADDINEKDGDAIFSIRTYEESGRANLKKFLKGQVKKKRITKADAEAIESTMEQMYETALQYKDVYAPFGAWSEAEVVKGKDGRPAFSVVKDNGEYVMNLDFSTVCKKRRTLDAVFSEMISRGLIDMIPMDGVQIAEINNIIRDYGFETACALCFVDAKRFRVAKVADKFCEMWNPMTKMSEEELRGVIKEYGDKKVIGKVAKYIMEHPEGRIELSRENLIDSKGFEQMQIDHPEILSLYKQAQGTSLAKIPFGDVQYLNDIEDRAWTPEAAYAVGGVRLQSFSDYIPRMFFDYMQMIAGLASKKLPVHAYTKEPIFAKQFGLTGIKINLSLVPKVVEGGVAAGLDAEGNYAWMEGETFPFEEAMALQNAEGYRENCGTIAVGVSDEHIEKMLDDPNIRMIIPYHKSNINPLVAKKNNIHLFKDYTLEQNTRNAEGKSLGTRDKADMPNFNSLMHDEGMDARQAAQAYLDWCDSKGFIPKFDKWRDHPNYYKLLEDFTSIVPNAEGVETTYPQREVTMTFPDEDATFGSIEMLIREGLEEDAVLEGQREEKIGEIVDTIEKEMIRFRTTYHGTPATFERFDHSFMGSGEGNQAFGWGTYVTEEKGIGEWYAKVLTAPINEFIPERRAIIDAQIELNKVEQFAERLREEIQYAKDNIAFFEERIRNGATGYELEEAQENIENSKENTLYNEQALKNAEAKIEGARAAVAQAQEVYERARVRGNVYQVEIPDDNGYNYLSWEGRLTPKQMQMIASQAEKEGLTDLFYRDEDSGELVFNGRMTSGEFEYKDLERSLGSDKAASEFLSRAGFTGIMYFGDGGNQDVRNYVIFNDADLEIKERTSFRTVPTFLSNAAVALEGIKQEKATPQQWLAMLKKAGGIKAGEDKWIGLSEWLEQSEAKTLTKQEVLDFINENQIQIEDVEYGDGIFSRNSKINLESELQAALENGRSIESALSRWDNEFGDNKLALYERGFFTVDEKGKIHTDEPVLNHINSTRLNYTTYGLENKREIALVVPTIESWNASDQVHFGDAGNGRAIAWIRFGETTDSDGKRVLVIDEIQSKRHQEGREKGYKTKKDELNIEDDGEVLIATYNGRKYFFARGTSYETIASSLGYEASLTDKDGIPSAPFEKNWAELAMKRMLRYAAEHGFDKVAWTKGDQQAERYSIGGVISKIGKNESNNIDEQNFEVGLAGAESMLYLTTDNDGNIIHSLASEYVGRTLSEVFGKELAVKMLNAKENTAIEGDGLRVGGEGMRAFYDQMLPSFMRKYAKKWGATVQDVTLPNVEEAGRTMHSVDVTESMRESVMQGQTMFRVTEVNDRFNERLLELDRDRTQKDRVLKLGRPSDFLKMAGIIDADIEMEFDKFVKKSSSEYENDHPFTAEDIMDLPKAIYAPIAVFDSTSSGDKVILTELKKDNKNFIVVIKAVQRRRKGGIVLEINEITTLYPKNAKGILHWIKNGLIANVDKEKSLDWLEALRTNHGTELTNQEISDAANIINNFELQNTLRKKNAETDSAADPNRYMFIGEQGARRLDAVEEATTRLDNLEVAKEMEAANKGPRTIKMATGWERGADGKWRYETLDGIDTQAIANITEGEYTLEDFVLDESLFDAYPSLRGVKVIVEPNTGQDYGGYWDAANNTIALVNYNDGGEYEQLGIVHEIQHAIQRKEGFTMGINPKSAMPISEEKRRQIEALRTAITYTVHFGDVNLAAVIHDDKKYGGYIWSTLSQETKDILTQLAYGRKKMSNQEAFFVLNARWNKLIQKELVGEDRYRRQAGEVEARNSAARRGMSLEERRAFLASETEDVAREDQLFIYDNIGSKNTIGQTAQMVGQDLATRVNLVERIDDITDPNPKIQERKRKARGWYDTESGEVFVVLPNVKSGQEARRTVFHEVVGHKGMRETVGEKRYNAFLEKVYRGASQTIRERIARRAATLGWDFNLATDEYLASLAEQGFEERENRNFFEVVRDLFLDLLSDAKIALGYRINDNDIRYMLWRTYQMQRSKGAMGIAEDMVMQQKLGVGNFAPNDTRFRVAENGSLTKRVSDIMEEYDDSEEIFTIGDVADRIEELLNEYDGHESTTTLENILNDYRDAQSGANRYGHRWDSGGEEAFEDAIRLFASQQANPSDDVRMRVAHTPYRETLIRQQYEERIKSGMYQSMEAMQDSMQSLHDTMLMILKEEGYGDMYIEDVASFENAYIGENRLSSTNLAEANAFANTVFQRLVDAIAAIAPNEEARTELIDYMFAKHGLERNEKMAERDAKREYDQQESRIASKAISASGAKTMAELIAEKRQKDYAGLTALTGKKQVSDAEKEAQRMVEEYENSHETAEIWERVQEVRKAILSKLYEGGLMSEEQMEQILDMYDYYIPLRGFDEKTVTDQYAYLTSTGGSFSSPIRKAGGRESKADDPFANLSAMAESAILQANRNMLVKQRFLNFVLRHPSDLVSVNRLWLRYDETNQEWVPEMPNILETDSPDEVARKVAEHEQAMKELSKAHPDRYKVSGDQTLMPYKVPSKETLKEHQVIVKRNGVDYVLTINGSPRLAQALNGLTNPDNDISGAIGAVLDAAQWVNRALSAAYTTRNPDFLLSNFMRDMLYTNTMVWVKESPNYALAFHKNYLKANPAQMKILYSKYNEGTLDMSDPMEAMFYKFIINGGETGYVNLKDVEQHKSELKEKLARSGGKLSVKEGLQILGDRLDGVNQAVENCARFAAFMTSQQMGRSVDRSIYDAKEISVNFNKKGAGSKFMGANGQTALGNTAAFTSGLGRAMYVFWNAAIQGTANFGRQAKRHPAKAFTAVASWFVLGALMAYLGYDDDDEDAKNSYFNNPEYVRRSNIMFHLGDGHYAKIPLPIEARAAYGLGELMVSVMSGKEDYSDGELASAIVGQMTQILPIDFMEGQGGFHAFIPSSVKPVTEIVSNTSWTGLPIYKDTPYNKDMPNWTKAYSGTNKYLVNLAATLNELSGGDKYTKGAIDLNPANIEYLLNGYFGGYFATADKLTKTAEMVVGARDFDPRGVLFLNRVLAKSDDRTQYRAVNNKYYEAKKEYETTKRRLRNYEHDTDEGIFNFAEKINFLYNSEAYRRMELFDIFRGDIEDLERELKDATSDEEKEALNAELMALKSLTVDAIYGTEEEDNSESR